MMISLLLLRAPVSVALQPRAAEGTVALRPRSLVLGVVMYRKLRRMTKRIVLLFPGHGRGKGGHSRLPRLLEMAGKEVTEEGTDKEEVQVRHRLLPRIREGEEVAVEELDHQQALAHRHNRRLINRRMCLVWLVVLGNHLEWL